MTVRDFDYSVWLKPFNTTLYKKRLCKYFNKIHMSGNLIYFNKTHLSYTVTPVANSKGSEILTLISTVIANGSLIMILQN
jgi:hypothetical protein